MTDWLAVDEVAKQFAEAVAFHDAVANHSFQSWARSLLKRTTCESPLEVIFLLWWTEMHFRCGGSVATSLANQVQVVADGNNYRLDFQVVQGGFAAEIFGELQNLPKIAVEVDGHAFHEKTPEQVALRNTRDRALQKDGWKIFHYSWRELTREPLKHVGEVWDYSELAFSDAYRDYLRQLREGR